MSTLIILIAQTKGEATLVILSLLLVAAIIGYITAWLYYKSIYVPRIKAIESEKHELNTHIVNLNADKINLQKSLSEKDNEIAYLSKEVSTLKALHAEDVHKTDKIKLKNKKTEQLLYEKNEDIVNLKQGMHLLDYNSFGTATEEDKDDLRMISGIGTFIEERLNALDIYTFRQISNFSASDIETIDEAIIYFSGRIQRDGWVEQAKELVHEEEERMAFLERIRARKALIYYNRIGIAKKEDADDLTSISGIGGWINEKLNALEIYTFRQISNFTKEDIEIVTEAIEYFPGRIERDEWIYQAKELIKNKISKPELLKHITVMKSRIYFDRLGVAHKHHANNLTLINGISLWIEEKLNMLDIYTFSQISKLTPTDVEMLTEILDISPGRIETDQWVKQARKLAKKQLSAV